MSIEYPGRLFRVRRVHHEPTKEIRARSPSKFHDEAWQRQSDHDVLQAEFLDFLRSRPIDVPRGVVMHRTVEAEAPLCREGKIVAYVDCLEMLTWNWQVTASLFKMKPRAETPFGAVRQVKALLALAEAAIVADIHLCHIVVRAGDPNLPRLRQEWPHTWAWGTREWEACP